MSDWGVSLTSRVPVQFCPNCLYQLDAVTSLGSKAIPEAEDFTVCIGCGCVLMWDADFKLTLSSLEAIPEDGRAEFAKVVEAVEAVKLARSVNYFSGGRRVM